jgi:hypothetical protein
MVRNSVNHQPAIEAGKRQSGKGIRNQASRTLKSDPVAQRKEQFCVIGTPINFQNERS